MHYDNFACGHWFDKAMISFRHDDSFAFWTFGNNAISKFRIDDSFTFESHEVALHSNTDVDGGPLEPKKQIHQKNEKVPPPKQGKNNSA